MAKAVSNLAIIYAASMVQDAEAKFTIETKPQSGTHHNVQYGKPIQLHLDKINIIPSKNKANGKKPQSLAEDCPNCGCQAPTCVAPEDGDDAEAEEIEKSARNMKKMIEKKEQKDADKELLKESKKKIEKANEDMKHEKELQEKAKNTQKMVAKIKKSAEGVKKKLEKEKKKEAVKE